jgi:L-threonylcarbamoyladenylate synthase
MLISSMDDLRLFDIELSAEERAILGRVWPGPVSVEMKVADPKFQYLSRGTGRFAMRLPADAKLRELLSKTGPLVAPSVNKAGEKPAETLDEAWETFPDLDFFIDGGVLPNNPSTLVSIQDGKLKVWRQGAGKVPDDLLAS